MNRRQFLQKTSAAVLALTAASYVPATFAAEKTRRVGLIGAGWYGKSDLWRLVQVAPVEIISICDPDKHMLAEAVGIATQRKSTPHLIDATKQIVEAGLLGKIGHVDMYCDFHMRANGSPPVEPVPDFLDYEMWTGPAPLRPYDGLPHKRWWRTFTEYGNGIVGDMCVHMLDTARWMLKLGWPKRISSEGGIFVQKGGKSNSSDTQTATFEYDGFDAVWQHRTWGTPPDPDYPWALFIYGEKGTLKASTMRADFIPLDDKAKPIHFECLYER